jgi:hypothetical protein
MQLGKFSFLKCLTHISTVSFLKTICYSAWSDFFFGGGGVTILFLSLKLNRNWLTEKRGKRKEKVVPILIIGKLDG